MSALFKPPAPGGGSYLAPQPGREMNGSGAALPPAASAYSAPDSAVDRGGLQTTVPPAREKIAPLAKQANAPALPRTGAGTSDSNSTVLSDADPETWIPGAQYAQNLIRRGGGSAQLPPRTPVQEIRVAMYNSAFRTLKQLEPNNSQLKSLSTSTWIPEFSDTHRLNEEIARIKAGQGLSELEPHHNFPRQFEAQFRACGIEPNDYLTYLPRPLHRLTPDGLHTSSINWNARWNRFLKDQPNARPETLLEQLHNMWKSVPWLGR